MIRTSSDTFLEVNVNGESEVKFCSSEHEYESGENLGNIDIAFQ